MVSPEFPSGRYAAPIGTPLEQRSLLPGTKGSDHIYEVLKPLQVDKGKTAAAFGQRGGGTQFRLPQSVQELIDQGYLRSRE